MPPPDRRATAAPERLLYAVCRHQPLADAFFFDDVWLVPVAVPFRAALPMISLGPPQALAAAVVYAGERAVLCGRRRAHVAAQFVLPFRRRGPSKSPEELRSEWIEDEEVNDTRHGIVALIRELISFYGLKDDQLALEQVGDTRPHPLAFWAERDLALQTERRPSRYEISFRLETLSWAELRALAARPEEEVLDLSAPTPQGIARLESTLLLRNAYVPDPDEPLERDEHAIPQVPLRTPLVYTRDLLRVEQWLEDTPPFEPRDLEDIDVIRPRNKLFGDGASLPTLLPEPEEEP